MTGRLLYVMEESSSKLQSITIDSSPVLRGAYLPTILLEWLTIKDTLLFYLLSMVLTSCVWRGYFFLFVLVRTELSSIHSSDLMQNPLIVPVKVLKGHKVDGELGRLTVTYGYMTSFVVSLRDEMKLFLSKNTGSDCVLLYVINYLICFPLIKKSWKFWTLNSLVNRSLPFAFQFGYVLSRAGFVPDDLLFV